MAEVIFMTGVVDTLDYAARLIRKKYREGARLAVYGPVSMLDALDDLLWQQEPLEFLPHSRLRSGGVASPEALLSPVWLLDEPAPETACSMAVNLGRVDLSLAHLHQRVAEIVGRDELERRAGRQRWRQYESAGHTLKHVPQDRLAS
jgi:DNA polymerase III subunit chi